MSHPSIANLPDPAAHRTTDHAAGPHRVASIPASSSAESDPVLCHHCGRTANNGISCEGYCVADSGY
ncbi:MAG: hypothetical protein ACKO7Z_07500 [Cyanobacteriota bacterium]